MPSVTTGREGSEKQMGTEKLIECPLCKIVGAKFLCDVDDYQIWRCPQCALDFVSPVPSEQVLKGYYDRKNWFEGGERGGYENYDRQTKQTTPVFLDLLTQHEATCTGRNILDVGCGYATHLAIAADRGWRPFGVEISAHALQIARERHGNKMFLADQIEALVPCEFDLILLFDVIEHTRDPFSLFFKLFSKGAIGPKTQIAITTPNARSHDAHNDPAKWAYRHPPSHLFFYSAQALQRLMTTLHFSKVEVSGLYPSQSPRQAAAYDDEFFATNDGLQGYSGLLSLASGSDFKEFMHERYVPGTWSKITEYEHFPRYVFAQKRAKGARVLDFGCGTGYGAALLADVASQVVGVDIAPAALCWASQFHNKSNLKFELCSDLGKKLPTESFDLITCFELIEHLSEGAQREFVENARRLLAPGGELLISTPNPMITVNYGENPYHLHEMDEKEFRTLLGSCFHHVEILGQWIRPSIAIAAHSQVKEAADFYETRSDSASTQTSAIPSNFVAVCSQQPIRQARALCNFDSSFDYIAATCAKEKKFHELQIQWYGLQETAGIHKKMIAEQQNSLRRKNLESIILQQRIQNLQERIQNLDKELTGTIHSRNLEIIALQQKTQSLGQELAAIQQTKIYRLRDTVRNQPISVRNLAKIVYLLVGMLTPFAIRKRIRPILAKIRPQGGAGDATIESTSQEELVQPALVETRKSEAEDPLNSVSIESASQEGLVEPASVATPKVDPKPYVAKILQPIKRNRPRIAHVIANFMIGGSSRLVVDLFERLGHCYEQEVITSYNPTPPAYIGLPVHEIRNHDEVDLISNFFDFYRPDLIHLHYWGDHDRNWYEDILDVIEKYPCKLIENINTPVKPVFHPAVVRYVYVSDYVRTTFGWKNTFASKNLDGITIYPGSDFELFKPYADQDDENNCIGMVYRLELDKLDESSIEVFIKVIQRRPKTKALIVGGGTLFETYVKAVHSSGVANNVTFTGYVPYENLAELYRKMSIFVAPVWKESFGHVSPLAMNLGIPVVGYDVGGLPEIIGDRELMAASGDADRLADIIVELLEDPIKRKKIGSCNRERAQKLFSVESMVNAYHRLYQETLGVPR